MLQITNLEKVFGGRTLFSDVSFSLTQGERLAIVGRNGTGKSTLFRIILGEESADSGEVVKPRGYRIGHLSQHLNFTEPTILREACRGLPHGKEDEEYRGEIILSGLGFSEEDMTRPASMFSGGFQIRLELARVLLSEPNLLLLDEPTNYLDIVSARWLEHYLQDWSGELIMISHDRAFLDAVSTHTMIIHRGGVRRIAGGTEQLYQTIEMDETVYEQTRQNQEKKRREMERFVERFKAKAGTASLAQSRQKMLEKMDIGEELRDEPVLDFSFTAAPFHGRALLSVEDLAFAYPATTLQPNPVQILKDFGITVAMGDRIGVIGKNGRGKSTLLRLLAADLKPTVGEIKTSPHARIGYFGQTNISRLTSSLTVEQEIMESSATAVPGRGSDCTRVRGICGTMMFSGDDALKRISVLSGGEKSRVLLGKLLAQPTNLLLLDEPTNHLDVESVAALVDSLESFDGAVLLVTHDEFMLRRLATRLVLFADDGVRIVEGDYDYFMETIGWGDEDDMSQSQRGAKSGTSKSERKQKNERKDNDQNRSKAGIEKKIANAENKITELEQANKTLQSEILAVSLRGNTPQVAKQMTELVKTQRANEQAIEELFAELESLSKQD